MNSNWSNLNICFLPMLTTTGTGNPVCTFFFAACKLCFQLGFQITSLICDLTHGKPKPSVRLIAGPPVFLPVHPPKKEKASGLFSNRESWGWVVYRAELVLLFSFLIGLRRIWLGFSTLSFFLRKGANSLTQDEILLSARARSIDGWLGGTDGMISNDDVYSWTALARWSHQIKMKLTAPILSLLDVILKLCGTYSRTLNQPPQETNLSRCQRFVY